MVGMDWLNGGLDEWLAWIGWLVVLMNGWHELVD